MSTARAQVVRPASQSRITLGAIAVVLLTLLAFSPALTAPLLFDDTTAIDHNPTIARLWPPTIALHPPSESPTAGRPIANYSLALNHGLNRAFGIDQRPDPGGPSKTISYHLLNLMLHVMSGLFLLGIVRRSLRTGRFGDDWRHDADLIALLVSAVWMLHPLQTEAVDYLAQRTELLVSFWYMATLYASIRAWDALSTSARNRWYAVGVAACFLGMGSKEVMVSAPVIVVLYDRAFRLSSWHELGTPALRSRRWFYVALFATLLFLAALVAGNPRGGSIGVENGMAWYAYLGSQGWAIPHYLRLSFWPSRLTIDYGYRASAGIPGLFLLVAVGVATLFAWTRPKRWGWLGFCGAWFFCILAPSSSVVPIATEIAAEHRVYLALAAVIVVAVVGARALLRQLARSGGGPTRSKSAVCVVAIAVITGLAALSFQRSTLYRQPEAIWRDAITKEPTNARAWNNLGAVLADLPVPRDSEADSVFRRAVQLDPSYAPALYNLATGAITHRQFGEAEQLLRRVTSLQPDDAPALARLGGVLLMRGDASAAIPYLERAVAHRPDDAGALTTLGIAKQSMGLIPDAAALFQRALQIDPSNGAARAALSRLVSGGP
jgi:Flp pilus assembly protein TadD